MIKGKKLTLGDFDILGSYLTGFGGMAFESNEQTRERQVSNTKLKNSVIDTCFAADTELYETGVECKKISNGSWVIVDEYKTKKEAETGHKKWVKYMKTNPKKLWSVQTEEWEL